MDTTMEPSSARRDDVECQSSAGEFLTTLIGSAPEELRWDNVHHLRGHARCRGREIVVIAGRDESHHTIVVTRDDWETIRVAAATERSEMLRTCAIESHERLLEVLDPV
jgi:hypothetical protein